MADDELYEGERGDERLPDDRAAADAEEERIFREPEDYKRLMESAIWKDLIAYAEAQLQHRKVLLFAPPDSENYNAGFTRDHGMFLKGEISGISLFMRMPEVLHDQSLAEREARKLEEEASDNRS